MVAVLPGRGWNVEVGRKDSQRGGRSRRHKSRVRRRGGEGNEAKGRGLFPQSARGGDLERQAWDGEGFVGPCGEKAFARGRRRRPRCWSPELCGVVVGCDFFECLGVRKNLREAEVSEGRREAGYLLLGAIGALPSLLAACPVNLCPLTLFSNCSFQATLETFHLFFAPGKRPASTRPLSARGRGARAPYGPGRRPDSLVPASMAAVRGGRVRAETASRQAGGRRRGGAGTPKYTLTKPYTLHLRLLPDLKDCIWSYLG